MTKLRPSDPNPDGITRFKDFCVACGNGIRLHSKPSYRLVDGVKHYTCQDCRSKRRLDTALDDLSKSMDKSFERFDELFADLFKPIS